MLVRILGELVKYVSNFIGRFLGTRKGYRSYEGVEVKEGHASVSPPGTCCLPEGSKELRGHSRSGMMLRPSPRARFCSSRS